MSDTAKWKSKLLSSSVPMEYEVAKTLVASGFAVSTDYAYAREDAGLTKEFSVDIHAIAYFPIKNNKNIHATLELLVECKHRHRANKWLFFPDPNISEMSPFTQGRTIRAVDEFSKVFFEPNCTVPFDEENLFCMKGVEIDTSSGHVHDAEIRHGLAQLQYAQPRLLADTIAFNLQGHEDDNIPFFFCPILLTTSELLVAHENISIEAVEQSSDLSDIAEPANFVVLYLDPTPEFARHREAACSSLKELANHPKTQNLEKFREERGEYQFQLPSTRCLRLADSNSEKFCDYFAQAIVCSINHFPLLVEEIKRIVANAIKTRKKRKVRYR